MQNFQVHTYYAISLLGFALLKLGNCNITEQDDV